MIFVVGLILLAVVLCFWLFILLSKKTKELETLKNSKQVDIYALQSEKSTLDIMLSNEKQKNIELKEDSNQRLEELRQELRLERAKADRYIEEIKGYKSQISMLETQLKEQNVSMQEKLELLQNSEAKLKSEFENLANRIFEDNSKKLNERNQESLTNVLNPVREQLKDFKQKVEDVYDKESSARGALQNELKNLKELNQKMTIEAHNLTNALRSSTKQQGVWGEMVLENVLEKSGLREGLEYFREKYTTDDEGKAFRPDVVVKLPDDRDIIIDAKTSLVAYNDYMATGEENEKKMYLKKHIESVRSHIKGLANKSYENLKGLNSLDFIFMFIPIEGALLLALDNDVNLYDEAFKQKIIIVSPTTLLVALRAVENTWRYEKQAQSIAEVYDRATKLYEKAANLIETFQKVGRSISRANEDYEAAFKQLQGNGGLISQTEKLKKVSNIKPKKEIDNKLIDNDILD